MILRPVIPFLLLASMATAQAGGLRGMAAVRLSNGGIGATIPHVQLRFTLAEPDARRTPDYTVVATTDAHGNYQVSLAAGRYYVMASHPNYQDYCSAPGFAVVSASFSTCNVFLREPTVTTVLLVRHAEKVATDPEEPLSREGVARAGMLMNTVVMSGATAVFSTNYLRTRGTVSPYAKLMGLPIENYDDAGALAALIGREHRGDVVLIAGHGNTVDDIMIAMGAGVPAGDIEDFDNLYVVTKSESGANAVNLQYGLQSLPDVTRQSVRMTTLLLARSVSGASPPQAKTVLHALKKAGVKAIRYHGNRALVEPLATAIGVTPTSFTSASRADMLNHLLTDFSGRVALVVGDRDDLAAILRQLNADLPLPQLVVPFSIPSMRLEAMPETANLIVATKAQPRATRALLLRFVPWE